MKLWDVGTLTKIFANMVRWNIGMLVCYNKLTFIQHMYEGPIYNMI